MAPNQSTITFTETDGVNQPTATYIYSTVKSRNGETKGRVDVMYPSASTSWSSSTLLDFLADVFLPAGYPHSVTKDYLPYQIFDSLQAFSSSIAGLLSSRAVLQGVGVGNANASPTSALLLNILQDASGRIATIFFAHRVGTALEPECKMYRFAADIFNDLAMVLDCLSPLLPAGIPRVAVLSAGGVLRALCGVAGGSSKASLSAHFSRWGNLAEVNAKDSSQETIISLIGMLVGSFLVSHITSFTATWISLIILIILHLSINYAAVRSVQMTSLNRQRANIVFSALFGSDLDLQQEKQEGKSKPLNTEKWTLLTPEQVSMRERIFETNGVLRWNSRKLGYCRIGVSLSDFLSSVSKSTSGSKSKSTSLDPSSIPLPRLINLFSSEAYILVIDPGSSQACILLKQSGNSSNNIHSPLKGWAHALLAMHILSASSSSSPGSNPGSTILDILSHTLTILNENQRFESYMSALHDQGWDLSIAALETRSGRRVSID